MSRLGPLHLTKNYGPKHTATVVFFHGSGDSGDNIKQWVAIMEKKFVYPHIKILYPTAPLQPYTPNGGQLSNIWFDRADISPHVPENLESLDKIKHDITSLIKAENEAGIPSNRIVVGGFSMGGAVAFHTAYRWDRNVAGAFAFSSFLNDKSIVYQDIKSSTNSTVPPFIQLHGDSDDLVDLKWGEATFNEMTELGVQGDFYVLEKLGHSINKKGMHIIREWIEKILPDLI